MADRKPGYASDERVNTHKYGNVEIVVYRPEIDDDERAKREESLRRAVAAFGKAKNGG